MCSLVGNCRLEKEREIREKNKQINKGRKKTKRNKKDRKLGVNKQMNKERHK